MFNLELSPHHTFANSRSPFKSSLLQTSLSGNEITQCRYYADYPDHNRVALPALSPTMELGTIVSWAKKEGK